MNNTTTVTIDLAKGVFQIVVSSECGKQLINIDIMMKKVRRFVSRHPELVICM
jgi:hypothetical protein